MYEFEPRHSIEWKWLVVSISLLIFLQGHHIHSVVLLCFKCGCIFLTTGLEIADLLEKSASKFDLYVPEITILDGKASIKENNPI